MLEAVFRETDLVVTLEENVLAGGFGSAVSEWAADHDLVKPMLRIGIPNAFIEAGNVNLLKESIQLDVDGVVAQISARLKGCRTDG